MLGLTCDATFDEVTEPDVLIFPGGIGTRTLISDDVVLDWVREVHKHTVYTTSVCTGGLVLAAAGLLNGLTATTHWRVQDLFNSLGATYVPQRVVEHLPERIITSAGVSSGIDMGLRLVELSPRKLGVPPGEPGGGRSQPADDRVRPGAAVRFG